MMSFGKDYSHKEGMSEAVEGGAALAWRLLATLEGGSLLLATSALLAYTVKNKIVRQHRSRRSIRNVLVTNTTNLLGRELKSRLEACGCVVETVGHETGDATSGVDIGAGSDATSGAISRNNRVDAIVVVGAAPKAEGLDGVAGLVTEDVYDNLRILDSVSPRVHSGGYIAWACARDGDAAPPGAFSHAGDAFDIVLRTSLLHVAKLRHCEPVWVGRCEGAHQAAQRTVTALLNSSTQHASRFSVRNAAHRIGECLGRWLKIIT